MDQLNFTVDSALLRELGEKLVETVHLALVELVKNSYDADATSVEILFANDPSGKMQIIISDNGTGMNFEAIQKYWMRIATTNKTLQKLSKVFGRPLSGAKGIGRFSCRRLGGHLQIITKGTNEGNLVGMQPNIEKTLVEFPWTKFLPGEDITSINCPGLQTTVGNDITGTNLIISNVSDEWTVRGYNYLKRQLAVLVANRGFKRKGFEEDPGFNVKIIAPQFEGVVQDIRSNLIKAGWGTLKAKINSEKQAVCELDALGIGKRKITSAAKFNLLEDISLELAIMVDVRTQIRDTSILSLGNLEKILNEWGGVQIKFKGLRIYPYGDDDWLDIDKERGLRKSSPNSELLTFAQTLKGVEPGRSLLNMLSMKSYVGNVEIGGDAEGFEPKLNREGFISTPAFDQLKGFVRFAIDWSTILRDYYIRESALREAIIAKEKFEEIVEEKVEQSRVIDSALFHLQSEAKVLSNVLPPKQKIEFEAVFERATDVIRKQHTANQVELAHLRLVASTSTLLLIFSHEVKSLLGVLEQSKNSLEILANELLPRQKKEVEGINDRFIDLKNRLVELLNLTSLVGKDNRKTKASQVALLERVKKVEKVFELITHKYQIDVDHTGIPNNIAFKNILEAEIYSILLNVMSNSIKSVIASGRNRKIQLNAERSGNMNILTIRDTGIGLDSSRFDEVFIPFISDPDGQLYENLDIRLNPEDNMIVGLGSGLGLGIVKEIVNARGGSIRFKRPTNYWNAELEIKMP
ncbi:MAG: ATP-binding protein [Bacteroidales bacterium]|nr:ATP-binding protein [Bacteroidales bacterium]MCF8455846.1 ATP-binding protein [Bacteroidales bacterium]